MSSTLDALNAMRAVFLAANPAPNPSVTRVHIYPNEFRQINLTAFPFVVIRETTNQINSFNTFTQEADRKSWIVEVKVYIRKGFIETDLIAEDVDKKHSTWADEIDRIIRLHPELFGEVLTIGRGDIRFQWLTGNISYGAGQPRDFWGLEFRFPINQVIGG